MGRLRIKKKESFIPFRESLGYRLLLLALSLIVFVYLMSQLLMALGMNNTPVFVLIAVMSVGAAVWVVHNISSLSGARVPQRTLKRMRHR